MFSLHLVSAKDQGVGCHHSLNHIVDWRRLLIRLDSIDRSKRQTQKTISLTSLELLGHVLGGLDGLTVDDKPAKIDGIRTNIAVDMGIVAVNDLETLARQVVPGLTVRWVKDRVLTSCTGLQSGRETRAPAPEIGTPGVEVEAQDLLRRSCFGSPDLDFR